MPFEVAPMEYRQPLRRSISCRCSRPTPTRCLLSHIHRTNPPAAAGPFQIPHIRGFTGELVARNRRLARGFFTLVSDDDSRCFVVRHTTRALHLVPPSPASPLRALLSSSFPPFPRAHLDPRSELQGRCDGALGDAHHESTQVS